MKQLTLLLCLITLAWCSLNAKPSESIIDEWSTNNWILITDQISTWENLSTTWTTATWELELITSNEWDTKILPSQTSEDFLNYWNRVSKILTKNLEYKELNNPSNKQIESYFQRLIALTANQKANFNDQRWSEENIVLFKNDGISYKWSDEVNNKNGWIKIWENTITPSFIIDNQSCKKQNIWRSFENLLWCGSISHIDNISPNIKYITFEEWCYECYGQQNFTLYSVWEDKFILDWTSESPILDDNGRPLPKNDRSTDWSVFWFLSSEESNFVLNITNKWEFPNTKKISLAKYFTSIYNQSSRQVWVFINNQNVYVWYIDDKWIIQVLKFNISTWENIPE